jgi:hypothetical protein
VFMGWIILLMFVGLAIAIVALTSKPKQDIVSTKSVPLVSKVVPKCNGCIHLYTRGNASGCKMKYKCGRALSEYGDQYQSVGYASVVKLRSLRAKKASRR